MRLFGLIVIGMLALVYVGLFAQAGSGYGYAGYSSFNNSPSFWYFGGPHYYHGTSIRNGSLSGPGGRGSGLHGGK